MYLHENLGFQNHPFNKTNADEEDSLQDYFVPPPYFDAIIGDPNKPSSTIVLAPRGAGKTAQRRMVEMEGMKKGFLAVTYDRFEFSANDKLSDINLQYHLRNIITRIVVSLVSHITDQSGSIENYSKDQKKQLSLFVQSYLGGLTGEGIQELIKELKGLPERFKDFWREKVGFMESVVNFILKSYDLEKIDLPDVQQEEKRLSETYKYQMESLLELVKCAGFKSIYILIDRPDETEHTGNDPEKTYQLIQPLIRDLDLLSLPGFGFKFFLWDQIEPFFRSDARPDRVAQYTLEWKREKLKVVLSKRLSSYSGGKISSFDQIMTEPQNLDDVICLLANGSPRNMIRLCELAFAIQGDKNPDSKLITYDTMDQATVSFSEKLFVENYGENILKEIQRVGRELFTTNYVANDILKITSNGARNKITSWIKVGLVAKIGTITTKGAKRPTDFYCVVDPLAVRLIHRSLPLNNFIADRWLPCHSCGTDNLVNIELYPDENEAICRQCGRSLI